MSNTTKTALIIGGVILAILIVVPVIWAGFSGYGWGMGPGMMGGLMMIPMVLFWGLIIWGIVALSRGAWYGCGTHDHSDHMDSALDVLKRRYARGEIRKEEFEEKKKDLV